MVAEARDGAPTWLPRLPSASSLWSSRWSLDNPITCHPSLLYDGKVEQLVSPRSLGFVIGELKKSLGPFHHEPPRLSMASWDLECTNEGGAFLARIPLAVDLPGSAGRSRSGAARASVAEARRWRDSGLGRFVVPPRDLVVVGGKLPVAVFPSCPDHHPLTFARGGLQVHTRDGGQAWRVPLGQGATSELLTEMVALLAYHYEPTVAGGTAITDVAVNDGDFLVRRSLDGSYDFRLAIVRHRASDIGTDALLSYLITLVAYEVWEVDEERHGIPVPVSNPSIAFNGVVRGRRMRAEHEGLDPERGEREAHAWLETFTRSPWGRSYRGWVERFLSGDLPPRFGEDLREHWWRLLPLQQRLETLALRARLDDAGRTGRSHREITRFVERLMADVGRVARSARSVNDASRAELLEVLSECGVPAKRSGDVADRILSTWPHRSWASLLKRVPESAALRAQERRWSFGHVVPAEYDGTLEAMGPLPAEAPQQRLLANEEVFGATLVPASLAPQAVDALPTFEEYVDRAMLDPTWGYYARDVVIGRRGHFETHAESLSPHFGGWIAEWAFRVWRDLVARGEAAEQAPFRFVELGAGNGRLARDVLDAVARQGADASQQAEAWRAFGRVLEYRIYEGSATLRHRQQELLGRDAVVCEGDARRPEAFLLRDFPDGLTGVVVTNEVPDTFGTHKVVFTPEGHARVALVVPRVEPALVPSISHALASRIPAANERVRSILGSLGNPEDSYLDRDTAFELMEELGALQPDERRSRSDHVWFEEAYVDASTIAPLAEHLRCNAEQYALALAAGESGVVHYVNLHACDFVRGLAAALRKGFVLTIDYGDTTWGLIQGARHGDFRLRVYGDRSDPFLPRPNDPYAAPGAQDITVDVDFTVIARAARDAGLDVAHFGLEMNLAGDHLSEMLAQADSGRWEGVLGNPVFKALVVGTGSSDALASPLVSSRPLWRTESDLDAAQRERAAEIRALLESV